MKRRFTIVAATLALLAIFIAPLGMMGQTRATIESNFTDKNLSVGTGELTWSASPAFNSFESSGSARGAQSAKANSAITMTSGSLSGTITKVVVTASTNGGSTKMSVKVGGQSYGSQVDVLNGTSYANTEYEFTGNQEITDGIITITITRGNCTFWVKKTVVTYTTGGTSYTVALDPTPLNGTVNINPTTAVQGATITLTPAPSNNYALYSIGATAQGGADCPLTQQTNGTYTFTMPDANVFVGATFQPATSTAINSAGITNTDVHQSTVAGSLTATVTNLVNNEAISGATVTWSSSDTDVATIASNGTITLAGVGTTTITATYEGNANYAGSSATYELTVINSACVMYDFTSADNFWINDSYTTHPSEGYGSTGSTYTNYGTFYYNNSTHDAFTASGDVYYFHTSHYYFLGKQGATLTLPTFDGYGITQVVVHNSGSCSQTVQVAIVSGNNTASAGQVWSTRDRDYIYNISENYQTSALSLEILTDNNAQITGITVILEEIDNNKVIAPVFSPAGGNFNQTQNVTITSATEGASVQYRLTENGEWQAYNGPVQISETTTIWAKATKEGMTESAVVSATFTRLYTITLTQPFHGSISCATEAAAGTTVAVTANPDVNYQFSSLTVTPSASVNGASFTMPAADVNVTATFAPANTYTVSFSINNKVEMTATTTGSFDVDNFVANVTTDGKVFLGWYDNDTRVSGSYNPGEDKTLVAVFDNASSAYTLVTDASDLHANDWVVIAANGEKNIAMSTTQDGNNRPETAEGHITKSSDYSTITINNDDVCVFKLGGSSGNWTFFDAGWGTEGGYLFAAGPNGKNYLRTQNPNDANGQWNILIDSNGNATITAQGTNTYKVLQRNYSAHVFSCYNSTQQSVFLYTKSASKAMRDGEVEATSEVAAVAANVVVTVKNEGIVYLTGVNNGTAANLVVEDGGQLVTPANVAGTMQKDVTGYGNTTVASNYYLITAPSTIDPQNVEDMLNTNGYDLYSFDQAAEDDVDGENVLLEWRNYNAEGSDHYHFNLEAGTGYLYANKENKTLNLAGTLAKNDNNETFAQSITYVDGYRFSGWNLVGNPYSSNASVNLPFYKMNSNGDGINGTAMPANSVIAPMEGVFVIASAATTQVTFAATTDAVTTNAKKSVNIDVKRDNELMDRAIVSFNGCTLSKLNLTEGATKLYFQQGQEEFAIVSVENEGELPVNFKASRNGRYTMSVDIEDLDMNYLHLIDNKTGNDVDLLATPSYTFQANSSDYESRFRLVFDANTVNENNTTTTFAYFNGNDWVVNNNGNATLQVIDMMGRVLSSQTISGNANVNINQAAGIYMLRLVNGENVQVQKVVVR